MKKEYKKDDQIRKEDLKKLKERDRDKNYRQRNKNVKIEKLKRFTINVQRKKCRIKFKKPKYISWF